MMLQGSYGYGWGLPQKGEDHGKVQGKDHKEIKEVKHTKKEMKKKPLESQSRGMDPFHLPDVDTMDGFE